MINVIEELENKGLILNSRNISPAKPIIIKETIPFRNGSIDFSKINGEYNYQNREIQLEYTAIDNKLSYFNNIYNELQTQLLELGRVKVKFDDIRGFWLGEIVSFSSLEEINYLGKFKIKLDIDPWRYSDDMFGDDIWDDFNFDFDVTEINKHKVDGSIIISITNLGTSVIPEIICSSNMTITINDKEFELLAGSNKLRGLKIKNGVNKIKIGGTGTIEFKYRKELL